jgi:hypothetical protein
MKRLRQPACVAIDKFPKLELIKTGKALEPASRGLSVKKKARQSEPCFNRSDQDFA